jgi:GNAT superfamily N-acetyltransferase
MARVVVREFEARDLPGAVEVLRRAHRRHLARQPMLAHDPDFELVVRREREEATGAVALDGDTVVGYLLGRHSSGVLGRHVWSTSAGHAADDPDLIFGLYTEASSIWVEAGLTRHFVFAPADREHVEPWFRLGFGASAFQAVRPVGGPHHLDGRRDIVVRLSSPEDLLEIATLVRQQALHLKASPSFSEITIGSEEAIAVEWRDIWQRDDHTHFVAELEGRIVGQLLLQRRPTGDLRVPSDSIDLASATTRTECRGLGVGRALTSAALEWASAHGFSLMTTDWRSTNLAAAGFWPHRGFRTTFVRLYRSIP